MAVINSSCVRIDVFKLSVVVPVFAGFVGVDLMKEETLIDGVWFLFTPECALVWLLSDKQWGGEK
jgi:hypothetical protein